MDWTATITQFLAGYAERFATPASSVPLGDCAYDAADAAGAAAVELRPDWVRGWWVLASLRRRTGALRGALDAVVRATSLAPGDINIATVAASLAHFTAARSLGAN